MIFLPLLNNITLLLSLSILYSLIAKRWDYSTFWHKVLSGILFGLVAVAGMLNPLHLHPGIIFDGRSLIISIGGLFGGPITAAISVLISSSYRFYLGGDGTIMGISVIISSALIGLIYHYIRKKYPHSIQFGYLLLFGIIVNLSMLSLTSTLPNSIIVLKEIALPTLIIFPASSLIICLILLQQESKLKTLNQLRVSEENYRILVEKASSSIVRLDRLGRILFINSFAQKEFGYNSHELIGKFVIGTVIPAEKKTYREFAVIIDGLFQKPDSYANFETEVICKNGERKWILWTYKVNHDSANENILEILCVGNDITLKKNAELALTQSEKKYRQLYESLMDAYVKVDMGGKIIDFNQAFMDLTGYSRSELLLLTYNDLTPKSWHKTEREIINEQFFEKGYTPLYEKEYVKKNGEIVPIELRTYLLTDIDSKPIGMWAIIRDVSYRQENQKEISKSEEKLRSLFRVIPAGIGVVVNRSIVEANDRLCEITGYTREELLFKDSRFLYPSDEDFEFVGNQKYWQLSDKGTASIETKWRCKNGSIINIQINFTAYDPTDLELGVTFTVMDITDRKLTELKLEKESSLLNKIIDNNPLAIGIADKEGHYLKANQKFFDVFKVVPSKEYTFFNDGVILNMGYGDKLQELKEGKVIFFPEILYNTHDLRPDLPDNPVWVRAFGFPIINSSNEIENFILIYEDISASKYAQQELEQSDIKFKSIIELAADAILVGDNTGNIIEVNQKALELTGYSRGELIGLNISALFTKKVLDTNPLRYDQLMEGKILQNERILTRKDGIEVVIEMNSRRMPNGTHTAFIRDISERINNEKRIRENELKYRTLFNTANDSIFLMDGEIFVDCNQKTFELFGCTMEQIVGKSPYAFSPDYQPDGRQSMDKALEKISAAVNGNTQFFEWKHKRLDGTQFDAEVSLNIVHLDNKQYIQAIVRDITERKKVEEAIKVSEERFRSVVTNTPVVTFAIDSNGIFTLSEGLGLVHLGLKPGQVVGMSVYEVYKDYPLVCECVKKALNGEVVRIDITIGNLIFDALFSPLFDEKQNTNGLIGVATDITQRKWAEETLKAKTEELDRYFTSSLDLLCIADSKGTFHRLNPEWEKTLGYKLDELIGTNFLTYIHPDDLQSTIDKISVLSDQKAVLDFANRYKCKNGSYRWIEWRSYPSGEFIYAVARDITERKIVEKQLMENEYILKQQNEELNKSNQQIRIINEQLTKLTEKAQESDRLKSAFLANMSHEIRTPMNGIVGFCELLQRSDLSKSELKSYVDIIVNSSNQLLSIINDIIDISKIEAGQVTIHQNQINPNSALTDVFNLYGVQANKKGVKITLVSPPNSESLIINIDEIKLKQIVGNLVNNAIKFTEDGIVEIGYTINDNWIEVYVKDDGIGISSENQSLIFERFRQVEGANRSSIAGTGLGLAISKSLVEKMGGRIWIESELGKGSKFSFTIPTTIVSKSENIIYEETKLTDNFNFDGKFILLVEDDFTNMLYLKNLLQNTNAMLYEAYNGKEAVDIISDDKIKLDLVLIDIKMPIMNGIEATRIIKSIKPKLPIIVQTAYALPEEKMIALESGCNDYIAKPINRILLLQMISKYIFK